jgi:hypothetical protein
MLELADGTMLHVAVSGADRIAVEKGSFAPEFGLLLERKVLAWYKVGKLPIQVNVVIRARCPA